MYTRRNDVYQALRKYEYIQSGFCVDVTGYREPYGSHPGTTDRPHPAERGTGVTGS